MSDILKEVGKNSGEKIVFSLSEFKGREYLDIRVHFLNKKESYEEWLPTKKGIAIPIDKTSQFFDAVDEIAESFRREHSPE